LQLKRADVYTQHNKPICSCQSAQVTTVHIRKLVGVELPLMLSSRMWYLKL